MKVKFGKWVVKYRVMIVIAAFLLLIPAGIGYLTTRINYDILSYLPEQIETMKGQDILVKEFGTGAFSFVVIEDLPDQQVEKLAKDMGELDHVKKVIWYGTVADLSIPREVLPSEIYEFFNNEKSGSQLMAVVFDDTMGSDGVMETVEKMDHLVEGHCFVSGMAAVNMDTKNMTLKETPIYVGIAAVLCLLVMGLTMDTVMAPFLFLLSIGMAIIYNLGSNQLQGAMSYLTQALAAVLQLAVTMDYSIFLWHSYEEQIERFDGDKKRAMAHAIAATVTSVTGSSVTTIAGFVALCFMSFTLGLDLGIVMAKGVLIGVVCCVTVLPSLILLNDKLIEKTRHKVIMPDLSVMSDWITRHYRVFALLFLVVLVPALWGYTHTSVYYDLTGTMPASAPSRQANDKLTADYQMGATHMILAPSSMPAVKSREMIKEIKKVKGVKLAVSLDSIIGPSLPEELIPEDIKTIFKNGDYQMMVIASEYAAASDEVNEQIDVLNEIVKRYDSSAMLIGEAPCTKDLIDITNLDFKRVSIVSIGLIFLIIAFVFRSLSLPVILVSVIEFAIFVNMGIPAYTGTVIPFIASIVIGTIQLGATVDYAILMTTKYTQNRTRYEMEKRPAVAAALRGSIQSVFVSALGFFAATFGVGLYSNIAMISSLCHLMARGAIISMIVVIFVLPSMLMIFDRVICASTMGMRKRMSTRRLSV